MPFLQRFQIYDADMLDEVDYSASWKKVQAPLCILLLLAVVSKDMPLILVHRSQSSRHFLMASAWVLPVPELIFGTPSNCSTPSPETSTGSLSTFSLFVRSGNSFPSQWTTNGVSGRNFSFTCLVAHFSRNCNRARRIELWLIGKLSMSNKYFYIY